MKKYIIENCPCYYEKCWDIPRDVHKNCADISDCLLKRIVETCTVYRNMHTVTLTDYARREVVLKVLDKLEIEEVNE